MADIEVQYKGSTIKQQTGSGTVVLHTEGKYCEDDIDIVYTAPSAPAPASLDDDVVFIDYDGTPLYSYTKAEFALLDALPANPSHTGLTAEGWNWTLADAKTYVAAYGGLVIGQTYATSDGKTRLYLTVMPTQLTARLHFGASAVGNVTIDWGDGDTTVSDSTSAKNYDHTYATAGDYVVTLAVASGTLNTNSTLVGESYGNAERKYSQQLRAVEIGSGIKFAAGYTFRACTALETITVPKNVTGFCTSISYDNQLYGCSSLKALVLPTTCTVFNACANNRLLRVLSLPKETTRIGSSGGMSNLVRMDFPANLTVFGSLVTYAYGLKRLSLAPSSVGLMLGYSITISGEFVVPNGFTSLSANCFQDWVNITKITIPASVTTLNASSFRGMISCQEYHFLATTPPTMANTNAFTDALQSGAKIVVPYSADHSVLNTYKTTSNWATYASYIVEESA